MLKWFRVNFESTIYFSDMDAKLIKGFIKLIYEEKSPDGLAIYQSKKNSLTNIVYYISVPEMNLFKAKQLLSNFVFSEISSTEFIELELVVGYNSEFE